MENREKPDSELTKLFGKQFGILLPEVEQLRNIPVGDIGIGGILPEKILMVFLGRIEGLQRDYLGHDIILVYAFLLYGGNSLPGRLFLFIIQIEHGGAVLAAVVRPLIIQLGRVMSDFEENFQQGFIAYDFGIKVNLYSLGMTGVPGPDSLVVSSLSLSAGVAGIDSQDPL